MTSAHSGSDPHDCPPHEGAEQRPLTGPRGGSPLARTVFWPAAGIISVFVVLALIWPHQTNAVIQSANSTIVNSLGWYYVLTVSGFVIVALIIALSRLGDTRLGRDDEKPEYALGSWFAMLFAAGMGIGLVFWGAGEPLSHFVNPPPGTTGDRAARARQAMETTFLHWGLHAWGIYVIVGLAVAYSVHRKGNPISLRWTLRPVLGELADGWLGDIIDVVAIVGTLFGVATSLGLGVSQVGAGLNYLIGWTITPTVLVLLITIIAGLAAVSVATGLDAGIKFLSNLNLIIAALLALVLLALGPTEFLLSTLVQDLGGYLQHLIDLSFRTLSFQGSQGQNWMSNWTTNYWGWWISWSPFVGIFVARISRGRTVREFIIGVMLVPTLVSIAWFTIFGSNAIHEQIFGRTLLGADGVDVNTVLFQLLERFPAGPFLSGVAMILVTIFFVTSSDSGSYVLSMLSCGGDTNPSLWIRLTWAVLSGAIAAVLLGTSTTGEGLRALQTMAILCAMPFSVVMIGMCVSVWRALSKDLEVRHEAERALIRQQLSDSVRSDIFDDLTAELGGRPRRRTRPIELSPELRRALRAMRRNDLRPGRPQPRQAGERPDPLPAARHHGDGGEADRTTPRE